MQKSGVKGYKIGGASCGNIYAWYVEKLERVCWSQNSTAKSGMEEIKIWLKIKIGSSQSDKLWYNKNVYVNYFTKQKERGRGKIMSFLKKDELVNLKQVDDFLQRFGKKETVEVKEKKAKTWLIISIAILVLAVTAVVVYKVFFDAADDFDEYDDFDDMDYEDDFDDFDDFDDEVIEEDVVEEEEEVSK